MPAYCLLFRTHFIPFLFRGAVGDLFQSKPTRIEREFTNVMRVVGLSMPPEEAEEMRDAQYEFEKAMANLSKITLGIRRDLPVELDPQIVSKAKAAWEDGRVGLNKLYVDIFTAASPFVCFLYQTNDFILAAPGTTLQRYYSELCHWS